MHLKIEDTRLSTLLNSVVVGGLIGLIVSIFRLTIEKLLIFSNSYTKIFPPTGSGLSC